MSFRKGEVLEMKLGFEPGNEWVLALVLEGLQMVDNGEGGFYTVELLESWEAYDMKAWAGTPYQDSFPVGTRFSVKPRPRVRVESVAVSMFTPSVKNMCFTTRSAESLR